MVYKINPCPSDAISEKAILYLPVRMGAAYSLTNTPKLNLKIATPTKF